MSFIIYFTVPFLLCIFLTPLVRKLAISNDLIAKPKQDRWHKQPTALLGGIAIYLSVCLSFLLLNFNKSLITWFIAGTIIFAVGIYDDFKRINPYSKLLIQIFISSIIVFFGYRFNLGELSYLSIPLSIIWIIGITNSFNLLDNIDGLACGIAGISSLVLFLKSLIFGTVSPASVLSLMICGACFGYLPYNFNPAKIFMGDSGSMFLGFSLAIFSMFGTTYHASNLFTTLVIPVAILGVPIFDTIFVSFTRKITGLRIFKGGVDHTSHRLVSLGLSERKTVLLLYLLSIIFGILALSYTKFDLLIVTIFLILTVIILLFFGMFLFEVKADTYDEIQKIQQKQFKNGKLVLNTLVLHKRRIAEVVVDFVLICVAYYSSYLLRFEGKISYPNVELIMQSLPLIIIIKFVCFIYIGLYKGVWKYVGITDLISIFKAVSLGTILSIISLTIFFRFHEYSRVVFIIDWLLTLFFVSFSRVLLRVLKEYFFEISSKDRGRRILIIGAGDEGEMVLREIKNNKSLGYQPVGFLDDDIKKIGKRIHGIAVLGNRKALSNIINEYSIEEVIIAISSARESNFGDIIKNCKELNIPCKKVSRVIEFIKWTE